MTSRRSLGPLQALMAEYFMLRLVLFLAAGHVQASDARTKQGVLLRYSNPKAAQVTVVAEFTDWKPTRMERGPDGQWTYQTRLVPGL